MKEKIIEKLIDLIFSDQFRYIAFPIGTIIISIFMKLNSRKDRDKFIKKEDFFIGLNIIITSIVLLFTYSLDILKKLKYYIIYSEYNKINSEKIINIIIIISILLPILYIGGLFIVSFFIRKKGWNKINNDLNNDINYEINNYGIIIPNIIGFLYLLLTFILIVY
ncbi:MAG: hypothetical protein EPN82_15890 [Bacteroidetes bacterium]|nr:MAG: hypothetical protein EPN82_15890 [Bacteroidota bacterium]